MFDTTRVFEVCKIYRSHRITTHAIAASMSSLFSKSSVFFPHNLLGSLLCRQAQTRPPLTASSNSSYPPPICYPPRPHTLQSVQMWAALHD